MAHIPPPPPGMFPPMADCGKIGKFEPPQQSRRKLHVKKPKAPIESFQHYIAAIINDDGLIEFRSSPNVKPKRQDWMMEAARKMREYVRHEQPRLDEDDLADQPKASKHHDRNHLTSSWPDRSDISTMPMVSEESDMYMLHTKSKRRRTGNQVFEPHQPEMLAMASNRSLYASQAVSHLSPTGGIHGEETPLMQIKVCQREAWETWFRSAFKAIQQQSCRTIAKEWIKAIHPKKQSTHPYNGNFPRNERASPERTRPPYWPPGIRHKEPDHIAKEDRTSLLVHLLMNTPQQEITPNNMEGRPGGKEIRAEDFGEALVRRKDELKDKWAIIQSVIYARQQVESYEEGGLDADTEVTVPRYLDNSGAEIRLKKRRAKVEVDDKGKSNTETLANSDESYGTTPTSPMTSIVMRETPIEPDNRDDMSAMNTSFSSDATQTSPRSARHRLRLRPVEACNNSSHMIMQTPEERHMMLNPEPPDMRVDYDHQSSIPHDQIVMSNPWPTTVPTDSRLNEVYANDMVISSNTPSMLDAAQFGQEIPVPMISYQDSHQFFPYAHFYPLYDETQHQPSRLRH